MDLIIIIIIIIFFLLLLYSYLRRAVSSLTRRYGDPAGEARRSSAVYFDPIAHVRAGTSRHYSLVCPRPDVNNRFTRRYDFVRRLRTRRRGFSFGTLYTAHDPWPRVPASAYVNITILQCTRLKPTCGVGISDPEFFFINAEFFESRLKFTRTLNVYVSREF